MMTPARRKREMDKADEEQRRIDEEKYVGFSVACNNDDGHGCQSLAEWYALLRGDYGKAADIYKANCAERRYANSCFNLGILYGETETVTGGVAEWCLTVQHGVCAANACFPAIQALDVALKRTRCVRWSCSKMGAL
jgi:hypothetical protein